MLKQFFMRGGCVSANECTCVWERGAVKEWCCIFLEMWFCVWIWNVRGIVIIHWWDWITLITFHGMCVSGFTSLPLETLRGLRRLYITFVVPESGIFFLRLGPKGICKQLVSAWQLRNTYSYFDLSLWNFLDPNRYFWFEITRSWAFFQDCVVWLLL